MTAYATTTQLYQLSFESAGLADFSTSDQEEALEAASRRADSYLRSRYAVPIASPDSSLAEAVCAIAAYWLLGRRGYNPESPADRTIKVRRDEAIGWLKEVKSGAADLDDGTDSTAGTDAGGGYVASDIRRGWGDPLGYDDDDLE